MIQASDGVPVAPRGERCVETHNPGVWPWTSRCVRDSGHKKPWKDSNGQLAEKQYHLDRHGNKWSSAVRDKVVSLLRGYNPLSLMGNDMERVANEIMDVIESEKSVARNQAERDLTVRYETRKG